MSFHDPNPILSDAEHTLQRFAAAPLHPDHRLPIAEQERLFKQYADQAIQNLRDHLDDPCLVGVLKRSALSRLRAADGKFGDSGWRKSGDHLLGEIIEEIADAIVYHTMREYARSNGPGGRHPLAAPSKTLPPAA